MFYIFIKISLNPAIRPYDKEGIKEERLSGILGYPPQSFLSVPQLDIAYPVRRPTNLLVCQDLFVYSKCRFTMDHFDVTSTEFGGEINFVLSKLYSQQTL